MHARTWKWLGTIVVLVGLVALWAMAPMEAWVRAFNGWIEGLGWTGYVVFGLVYVVATVALMPGSVLTLAAGLAFGLKAFFVVLIGATLGAWAAFLIGRYLARSAVEERFGRSERFQAVDQAVGEEGWKIVMLMRLSPLVPFNLQNYLFGLTDVRFWHYAWATFFGIMPGTLMYVYFGAAGRAALNEAAGEGNSALRWTFFAVGLVATIIVTVIVTRKARAKLAATRIDATTAHGE